MLKVGRRADRSVDQLRPGLFQTIVLRLRALNDNTRRLLRLLEDSDWAELGARALHHVRNSSVH